MELAIGLIISFYICVVLAAFGLAFCYFMTHKPEVKIPQQKQVKIELENGVWYGYIDSKYIAHSPLKQEVETKIKEYQA